MGAEVDGRLSQCSYRNHKSGDISISQRHPRGRKKNSTESAATGNRCALFRTEKSPYGTKNSHPGMAIHVAAQIAALRELTSNVFWNQHTEIPNTSTTYKSTSNDLLKAKLGGDRLRERKICFNGKLLHRSVRI
ncbi:hypothetical protein CEXT_253561 [Caerostris extrusa]|uniref:Uncharacterized protein n=1 Tax=Caerostris extrusa TaxID=172846 RepID=A0AAV4MA43_CAEEX|nr:hypothetical protein CEXT_253561 [Caerostris extrusa]